MATKRPLKKLPSNNTNTCGVFSVDEKRLKLAAKGLPDMDTAESIASTFKALAHPTRVRILRALGSTELCVCEISQTVGLSISATSHQLSLLKSRGLVKSRADGKQVHYSLGDPFVISILDECSRHFEKQG